MAKVKQNPVQASVQKLLPSATPPKVGRTVSITPTSISATNDGVGRDLVKAAVLSGIGNVVTAFADGQIKREEKKAQIDFAQQQKVLQSRARASLLGLVTDSVNSVQALSDDPLDFDASQAKSTVRANVLQFMTGDQGVLITNDTLRLALDEADTYADSLTPKTTFKLEGGRATIIEELDGEYKINSVIEDEDQAALNDMGTFANTHPTLAQNIINNDDLTFDQKVEEGERLVNLIAEIREDQLMSDVAKSRNPVSDLPEGVKKARAKADYFNTLKGHSSAAMSKLITSDFDPKTPGVMIAMAEEYESDMNDITLTDQHAAQLSEQYAIDVFDLVEDRSADYVKAQANFLRSLDELNIKKRGSEAAVADMTVINSELKQADAEYRSILPPKLRFLAQAGFNLQFAPNYETMIKQQSGQVPEYDHLIKAMVLADSRFKDMGKLIRDIPDDDLEPTRRQVQDIMKDFFVDATNWAKRDYIDSLDVGGYVNTMKLMRDAKVFERLEPENFRLLEELYEKSKSVPVHTDLINKLERNEDVSPNILEAYRENIRQQILERSK